MKPRFGEAIMQKEKARIELSKIMQEQGDSERRKGARIRILLGLAAVFLAYHVLAGRTPPPAVPTPKVSDLVDAAKSIESLMKNSSSDQARLALGEKPLEAKPKRDLASMPDSKRENLSENKIPSRLQSALNKKPHGPKPGYNPASPKRAKLLAKNERQKIKNPYARPNKKQTMKTAQRLPSSVKGRSEEKYSRVAELPARIRWNLGTR
ncbi:MAG: hypothetical protein ACXVBE_01015 [Bdellovibrionota bacterium]